MNNWAKCRSMWQQTGLFSAVPLQVLVGPVALWVSVVDTSGALDLDLYGMIHTLNLLLPSKINPLELRLWSTWTHVVSVNFTNFYISHIAFPLTMCLLSVDRKHASSCQNMTKIRTFVTHLLNSSWPQRPLPRVVSKYQLFRANWGVFHTNKCG